MTGRRVLVTGASVAGPAAASWLARAGAAVTVLERAPEFRDGGQNIDVRATGREVLRLMGLEDAVRGRNTGEIGTRFLDDHGGVVSSFPVGDTPDGPTAELEILRGALARIVVDACPDTVEWRFGDRVTAVAQDDSGVDVTFGGGSTERFDLLVIAEGAGSATRGLVFGDAIRERPLGMYSAYGTIPRTPGDDRWWRVLIAPGARQVMLRPDDVGTTRASLNFRTGTPVLDGLDDAAVRAALRDRFAGLGWEAPRILDGFDTSDDLYVDWLRQISAPAWHHGRVCLLGDAAWCVTPIGGGGAGLALTGAYVLAAFLTTSATHAEAFRRYDAWMRPLITDAQKLPPGVPRLAAPRSRAGVRLLRRATRIAALPLARSAAARLISAPRATRQLPAFAA